MYSKIAAISAFIAAVGAQQFCTSTPETHPKLSWSKCTANGCSAVSGSVVVDSNWRWTHQTSSTTNCYDGNEWDTAVCTSNKVCAEKCCLDGADYSGTYGVTTSGNQMKLQFVTKGTYSTNIGSRLYLLEDDDTYEMFTLLGNEFTFDVDVSGIGCGLNGALYFVSMDEDGGKAKYSGNKAGARYGTGYCDSQCPRDLKFINGEANVEGWEPSADDINAGIGKYGSCCPEMDIWEANNMATAYTPHPCDSLTQSKCTGDACGGTYSNTRYAGTCDPDGCDFNSYRQGATKFYGKGSGYTVDTTKKMTVVTQFIKGSNGKLSEIKRFYVQNGNVIPNSESTISGVSGNSITSSYCSAQASAFGSEPSFSKHGGLSAMSDALAAPMVLVLSLWHDHYANMLWLDSTYPIDSKDPGAKRGECATTSGKPSDLERDVPNSSVIFSNIKFGTIGSTYGSETTNPDPGTGTGSEVAKYGQCGGSGWTGSTKCVSGSTCTKVNDWYSQCL